MYGSEKSIEEKASDTGGRKEKASVTVCAKKCGGNREKKREKSAGGIKKQFFDAVLLQNPILVQLLGMCSVLAVSTTATNAVGMGAAVTAVLIFSNILISLMRRIIPAEIRIAAFIVIISGFVTAVQLLIEAYLPALDKSLGVFIPLIVVNCIILARAEAFASKNRVLPSALDGLFMGLGYTAALLLLSIIREFLGYGSFFGISLFGEDFVGIQMFVLPSGAFILLGILIAAFQALLQRFRQKKEKKAGLAAAEDRASSLKPAAEAGNRSANFAAEKKGAPAKSAVAENHRSDAAEEKPACEGVTKPAENGAGAGGVFRRTSEEAEVTDHD